MREEHPLLCAISLYYIIGPRNATEAKLTKSRSKGAKILQILAIQETRLPLHANSIQKCQIEMGGGRPALTEPEATEQLKIVISHNHARARGRIKRAIRSPRSRSAQELPGSCAACTGVKILSDAT